MPAGQDFLIAMAQGEPCVFHSSLFPVGVIMVIVLFLLQHRMLGVRGVQGKQLLVHGSPDYKLPHMDLMERIVYHSELLDFEQSGMLNYMVWGRSECVPVGKRRAQRYLMAERVHCGRDG